MMNKQKKGREDTDIRKTTWIGIASLLTLLILFCLITLSSTTRLTAQVKLLTEHPFAVNGDIGDIKTDLALMRLRTERLQSYRQSEDIKKVRDALDELYTDMDRLLDEIDRLYLGPSEDTAAIRQVFQQIRETQGLLLKFAELPDSTAYDITAYEEEHLFPLYEQFEGSAQRILTYVRNTQQNIFTSAEQMGRTTLVWSLVITAISSLILFFFQFAIRRISRRLYEKNRQFEILSDTVDETFIIFELSSRQCDFVSGSAERLLGLSADRLKEDRTLVYQFIDESTAAGLKQGLLHETNTTWNSMIEYHHPRYTDSRWIQLRSYRITESGKIKCIVTLADRTEERQAAQVLQDALTSAQNANNAKKDFLSRMSHEIRTPMNAIIGMTTIAAASTNDRSRVEYCLEKIGYSSRHLLMLINDVLDMSRIESNRVTLNREPFELYQFLNSFVSVVYPQANGKGLEFAEKTTGFSEHTTYLGDSLRLNQILLNLTSNAIKFTPRGGKIDLEVLYLPPRDHKSWIRFIVSDTGIGMDEDALNRLYTPFEQADASIAFKYGGTGLGMSITQNLVFLMGGHIDVKSTPGKGTVFTVELPFEQSDVDLQPLLEGSLESLTVLVADDDPDICEHTALLLNKMKIHADWVLSGTEAVERAAEAVANGKDYDICIIDWKMPDMDGIETARRLRDRVGKEAPIIIISAYDWSDIEEEARKAGVTAFITKPLFQSSLYNVLVSVTNGAFGISGAKEMPAGDALRGRRLLLAEDNVLNTEIAVTLLEMNGAEVESVENGRAAVERFLEMKPGYYDAILMDVQMPVMDGYEATKEIRLCGREDARHIPIIATTANAFSEDISAVLAAGMDAHISKPLDIRQLCTALSRFFATCSAPVQDPCSRCRSSVEGKQSPSPYTY